jgi:RNA polymerase sigma-70 factor, ECF subfamily
VSDPALQFERVFEDCYDAVYRYAARRVPAGAVQDVVSETFLTAWRRRAEVSELEPLPWLLATARRAAANHRRGSARRDALQQRLSAERPPPQELDVGGEDPRLALALAALAERDREALMLVAWDGLEHRVAATVMGCSTGAFTVRVHRARRKLERALALDQRDAVDITQEARSLR